MVPQVAVMENEPPGFLSAPRGDVEDPQMVRLYKFSDGFNFHGNLER